MRHLLLFTGSLIYLLVMVIISPLLAVVYAGLETIHVVHYLKTHRPVLDLHLPELKISLPQLHLRKYAAQVWTKAIHFHL